MSIIMTAGNKKVEWSPKAKDQALTKVASTDGQEVQEKDELFEAAKGVVEAAKKCDDCDCNPCECEDKKEEIEKEAGAFGEEESVVLDIEAPKTNGGFESATEEVSEEVAVGSVEEAVEAVEEAVEDLKAVVSDEAPEAEESEEVEVEIEVIDEEPVSEEGEIVIESEPDFGSKPTCCESCGATVASSGEEFVKYASISPSNRKKLRRYWKGMLNYVPDYVDLMTK